MLKTMEGQIRSEFTGLDRNWQQEVAKKIQEGERKRVPLRFVENAGKTDERYITIDRQSEQYTVVAFDTYLNSQEVQRMRSAVVLEREKQAKLLVFDPQSQSGWSLASNSGDRYLLKDNLHILKRSKLHDPSKGGWKGEYPNVNAIIEALPQLISQ